MSSTHRRLPDEPEPGSAHSGLDQQSLGLEDTYRRLQQLGLASPRYVVRRMPMPGAARGPHAASPRLRDRLGKLRGPSWKGKSLRSARRGKRGIACDLASTTVSPVMPVSDAEDGPSEAGG